MLFGFVAIVLPPAPSWSRRYVPAYTTFLLKKRHPCLYHSSTCASASSAPGSTHRIGHSRSPSGLRMPDGQACGSVLALRARSPCRQSLAENTDHRSAAVVAPLEDRRGQGHKPPEQVEGFRRIRLRDRLDDCATLN